MKAYLLENPAPLPPFDKPASKLRLRSHTLASRLEEQLRADGFDVVFRAATDASHMDPGSICVRDDLLVSPGFFRRFVRAVPDMRRNFRCEIESSRLELFGTGAATESYRELSVTYLGDRDDATFAALRMTPPIIIEVSQGLPPRMHRVTDLRVRFVDFYGVRIDHWFDFHKAVSLYCRELATAMLRPACAVFPASLVLRMTSWSWLAERFNSIGKRCRIHRTAILEGCVVGDDVEIGPFAYLRGAVIGDGALVAAKTSMRMSYVGDGAFILGSDLVNSYVGRETSIVSPMLFNVVFGERGFLSGGSGFADFSIGGSSINANIGGKDVPSGRTFLGSAVGDDCFLGANLVFAPGRTIPDRTHLLDNGLVKSMPTEAGGTYVLSGAKLLRVPDAFMQKERP